MTFVIDDTIRIPPDISQDLSAFREWTKSDDYPERGEFAYLNGELWVDLSMETWIHNQIKTQIAAILAILVQSERLGRFYSDRMRLVREEAGLSTEPDGMFVSLDALRNKRVRLEQATDSLEVVGSPDLVLEVVRPHSVQKDTVVLREIYAAAGIAEYWLVNPLGEKATLDVLRLTSRGYVLARKSDGWMKSTVLGKSFRLESATSPDGLPEYRLLVR